MASAGAGGLREGDVVSDPAEFGEGDAESIGAPVRLLAQAPDNVLLAVPAY
jgi:hypothetical protein